MSDLTRREVFRRGGALAALAAVPKALRRSEPELRLGDSDELARGDGPDVEIEWLRVKTARGEMYYPVYR